MKDCMKMCEVYFLVDSEIQILQNCEEPDEHGMIYFIWDESRQFQCMCDRWFLNVLLF